MSTTKYNPDQITVSQIPVTELMDILKAFIREEIRAAIREEFETKAQSDLQEKFLSPDEARKLFHPKVSLPTISNWAEQGLLKKYHIGGRTYFKYGELVEAVSTIKRNTRKRVTSEDECLNDEAKDKFFDETQIENHKYLNVQESDDSDDEDATL